MEVVDFDEWAARQGVTRFPVSEAGLHTKGHGNDSQWSRELKNLAKAQAAWQVLRDQMRQEYEALRISGKLTPYTSQERLEFAANKDTEQGMVARRVLEKRNSRKQQLDNATILP